MQWLRPEAAGQAYSDLVHHPGTKHIHVYPDRWKDLHTLFCEHGPSSLKADRVAVRQVDEYNAAGIYRRGLDMYKGITAVMKCISLRAYPFHLLKEPWSP